MVLVAIGVVVAAAVVVSSLLLRWNEVRYSRKRGLPPGTMGWPLFGETTEFLKQGPSFMKARRLRYGSVFRTHILGCPTVVCMEAELNRRALASEGRGFVPGYPQSMLDILGRNNIAAVQGPLHRAMRGAMLSLVRPAMIRSSLLPKIDAFMRSHLAAWSSSSSSAVVDIQAKTKEMALLSALRQIAGVSAGPLSDALKAELYTLVLGTISLPINLPGTNYYQGFKARKKLVAMLEQMIAERRSSGQKEHFDIRKGKAPEDAIDWNDFKSMTFTRAVIFETLRLATVVNGLLRKTTQDVEMNGYVIPKGWRIYVYTREINYDPFLYPDPMTFNPWRWLEKNMESHPHFMLFGGGSRMCPGKEVGTVEIATFLHYFVTQYRWEEEGNNTILKFPRVEAPNGLHIRVQDY
ncbi:hypothetical protein OsJ_11669 [Oryza sativa Japonica Group]|uniref:Cytochrome P450 85A1 n=1 Tax=Oryza sativa subsp. japonica TaxID=39947 RepID=A3AK81_ORYSJ|nr:hypothetical protein OsJ_11669 [Oryza sativa Japonica Group]